MRANLSVLAVSIFVAVGGCTAQVSGPRGNLAVDEEEENNDREPPLPTDPPSPAPCELAPAAVAVLPRTSTHEFQGFVEDLLGSPVDDDTFQTWTPLAKVFGFDTMTEARVDTQTFDAMFVTTATLAGQLSRAPRVTGHCPVPQASAPACALHDSYDAQAQFSSTQGRDCWSYLDSRGAPLTFNAANNRWEGTVLIWDLGLHPGGAADVVRRFTVPLDGIITITGSVGDADPGGGDGVFVHLKHRGATLVRQQIPNGSAALDLQELVPRPLDVRRGDVIDLVIERGADDQYDTTALTLRLAFRQTPPTAGLTWESCAGPAVTDVASRAYRHPLDEEDQAELKTVFDETLAASTQAGRITPFYDALEAALQRVLLSPHVHYKPEFVPSGFGPELEQHRIAARLALTFAGSFPDDALRSLADARALSAETVVRAEAARLLRERPAAFVQNFAGQWLDFRKGYAGADDEPLAAAMRKESHDVFAAVLAEGLPPGRLMDPGFTIIDDTLAAHYGLTPATDGTGRVATTERGGLLTQGHMLTSTASGTDFRRVINRGLWTLTRALCMGVPPLDPATREEIDGSVGSIPPGTPLAEQMQIHRESSERCIGCHGQMDPLGLALERYDAQGRVRTHYDDGSSVENSFDFNGTPMPDPDAVAAFADESGAFGRCVAEKLFVYSLTRPPRDEEACVIDALAASERTLDELAIDAFIVALHLSEPQP